jgi:hypothetical protein
MCSAPRLSPPSWPITLGKPGQTDPIEPESTDDLSSHRSHRCPPQAGRREGSGRNNRIGAVLPVPGGGLDSNSNARQKQCGCLHEKFLKRHFILFIRRKNRKTIAIAKNGMQRIAGGTPYCPDNALLMESLREGDREGAWAPS